MHDSYIDDSGIEIFKVLSNEVLKDSLVSMYQSATNGNIALAIAHQNVGHWVSFAMVKQGEQIYVFYKDSRGQEVLKDAIISNCPGIEFIANTFNEQGSDYYHGGIFALRNMSILAEYLQELRELGEEEFRDFKRQYATDDMYFCSLDDARADRNTIIAEYFVQGLYENYFTKLLKANQANTDNSSILANILYDRESNPASLKRLLRGQISLDASSIIVEILQNSGRIYFIDDTALNESEQSNAAEEQKSESSAPAPEELNQEQQREKVGKAKTKLTSLEKKLANLVSSNSFTSFVNSKGDYDLLQMLSRVFGINIILFKDKNRFIIKCSDDLANTPLILLASTPADKHHNLRYFALKEASAYTKEHQAVLLSLLKSAPINQAYNKAISENGFSHFNNLNDEKVTNAIRIYTTLQYHKAVMQNKLRGEVIIEHFNEWRSKTETKVSGGPNNSKVISNPSSLVQRANKISAGRNYDEAISLYNEAISKEDYYNAIARYMKAYNTIQKGASNCRFRKEAEIGYVNDAFEELAKTFHEIENIHKVNIQSMIANLVQVENADNQQTVKLTQLMEQLQAKMKFLCEWQKNINTIIEQASIKQDEKDTFIEVSKQISSVELNKEGHEKYKIGSEYINKGLDFTFEVKKEKIVRDTDWWAVGFLTAMAVFQGIVGVAIACTGNIFMGASIISGGFKDLWKAYKVGTGQEEFKMKDYLTSKSIDLAISLGSYYCLSSMGFAPAGTGTSMQLITQAVSIAATNVIVGAGIDLASTELAKDLVYKFKKEISKKVDKAVDQIFTDYGEQISILLIDDAKNFSVKNRVAVNKALADAFKQDSSKLETIIKGILHKTAGNGKSIPVSLISGVVTVAEIGCEIHQTEEIIKKVIKKVGHAIADRASSKAVKAEDLQNIDVSAKKEEWKGAFKLTLKKVIKGHLENKVIKPITDVACSNVIPNVIEISKRAIKDLHKMKLNGKNLMQFATKYGKEIGREFMPDNLTGVRKITEIHAEQQQAKQKQEQEALDLLAEINGNKKQGYMQMAPTPKPKLAERGTFQKRKLEERQAAGENMARNGYRLNHIERATAMPGSTPPQAAPAGMGDKPETTFKPKPCFSSKKAPEHLIFNARPEDGNSHSQLPSIDLDVVSMPMSAFMLPADKTVPIYTVDNSGDSERPDIDRVTADINRVLADPLVSRGRPSLEFISDSIIKPLAGASAALNKAYDDFAQENPTIASWIGPTVRVLGSTAVGAGRGLYTCGPQCAGAGAMAGAVWGVRGELAGQSLNYVAGEQIGAVVGAAANQGSNALQYSFDVDKQTADNFVIGSLQVWDAVGNVKGIKAGGLGSKVVGSSIDNAASKNVMSSASKGLYDSHEVFSSLKNKYGKDNVTSSTVPDVVSKNVKLAGEAHPKTGIVFDTKGYPIFDKHVKFDTVIPDTIVNTKISDKHKITATKNLKESILAGTIPKSWFTKAQLEDIMKCRAQITGYTWHHHQDFARMQLIPRDVHKQTGHIGGMGLWFY